MRHLITLAVLVLAGCGSDFQVHDSCTTMDRDGREYAACSRQVDHAGAIDACVSLGATLVGQPATHDETENLGEVVAFAGTTAWVGWPDTYECAVSSRHGGASPRDCDEVHAFVCEFPVLETL